MISKINSVSNNSNFKGLIIGSSARERLLDNTTDKTKDAVRKGLELVDKTSGRDEVVLKASTFSKNDCNDYVVYSLEFLNHGNSIEPYEISDIDEQDSKKIEKCFKVLNNSLKKAQRQLSTYQILNRYN